MVGSLREELARFIRYRNQSLDAKVNGESLVEHVLANIKGYNVQRFYVASATLFVICLAEGMELLIDLSEKAIASNTLYHLELNYEQ